MNTITRLIFNLNYLTINNIINKTGAWEIPKVIYFICNKRVF